MPISTTKPLENGWPECDLSQCDYATIPSTALRLPFQRGIPVAVMQGILRDLNQYVESVLNLKGIGDEGSWTENNSVFTSNHKGATAFDYNWDDHPMGVALAGWHGSDIIDGEQEPEIRRILAYYTVTLRDGTKLPLVFWGNDWNSPKDSMHFQMGYGTYDHQVEIWEWINTHIRPDGYSTYRRGGDGVGGAPMPEIDEAKLLGDMMGNVPGVDYDELLPYVSTCLERSDCNSDIRIDMWGAQIGHESVGLKYMKEIGDAAYFSKYNNRADLGNGPTDGPRYPGRGPIQVTGRHNYRELSQWAYEQGYVDTPTFFEDHPEKLEELQYAFLGAEWYWTVARPDINELCDQGDVETVTRRINGGTNGLQDRINRWNHCRTIDLLPLLEGSDFMASLSQDEKDRLMLAVDKIVGGGSMPDGWLSRAMFAPQDEEQKPVDDTVGMLLNDDGNSFNLVMIAGALIGVERDVQAVKDTAAGKFPKGSFVAANPWLKKRSIEFAKKLEPLCGLLTADVFEPAQIEAAAPKKRKPKAKPKATEDE